jgi:hypothetical protein
MEAPQVNEDHAGRVRIAASRLAEAERVLMKARKNYDKALRAWDSIAQVKLDTTEDVRLG